MTVEPPVKPPDNVLEEPLAWVCLSLDHVVKFLGEVCRLRRQVDELQAHGNAQLDEIRSLQNEVRCMKAEHEAERTQWRRSGGAVYNLEEEGLY